MNKKYFIELTNKEGINIENIYNEILSQIFFFNKTFFSFKSENGKLYYRDSENTKKTIWKEALFDKENETVKDGEKINFDFISIFDNHIPNTVLDNSIPLNFNQLREKYKEVISKNIKRHSSLFTTIVFFFLLKNNEEILLNENKLTNEELLFIEDFNKLEDFEEQKNFLFQNIKKKFSDTFFDKIISDIFNKKDIKHISKINQFFDSRVVLPGKYLIKHNELIFSALFFVKNKK